MAVSGNSLVILRRAIAQELGSYFLTTTGSISSSSTNLMLNQANVLDSEAPTERYGGWYSYIGSGSYQGQQARVTRAGFNGSTGATTLANAINLTGGVQVAAGVTIEMHGVMPAISQDGLLGIRECINRALRKLWVVDRYEISATTGQFEYDLTMWWASKRRFVRLLDPEDAATGRMDPATQGWRIVRDAETWTLQLDQGYATGETFALVVERPENSRLYVSSAWAEQSSPTAGLVSDNDACLGNWNDVYQACLYECYAALAVQAGGARKSYWASKLEEQRTVVAMMKLFEMDSESVTLGEGSSDAPGTWANVRGDHGFWSR